MSKRWENRLWEGELEYVAPQDLMAHPLNYKVHTEAQQEALKGSLDELGWIDSVRVNRSTGLILNGHLRVMVALKEGESQVPVTYVDIPPELETKALAYFDSIGQHFFQVDEGKWQEVLAQVSTEHSALQGMLAALGQETLTPANLPESMPAIPPSAVPPNPYDDAPGVETEVFDSNQVEGAATEDGALKETYYIYLTFPVREQWLEALELLAPEVYRQRVNTDHKVANVDAETLLTYWQRKMAS